MPAKRFLGLLFTLTLALLCAAASYGGVRDLRYTAGLSLLHDTNSAAADYDAMLELEPGEFPTRFTLFRQLSQRQVGTTRTGRYRTVDVIQLRGESRLVIPAFAALALEDTSGCLLDRETASALFGSAGASGELVRYDSKDYTVRGVFDSPAGLIVLQTPKSPEISLPQIAVQGNAAEFRLRHGTGGSVTRQAPLTHAAALLCLLPVITAALLLISGMIRLNKRWREYPLRRALLSAMLFALVTAGILSLLRGVPGEYLPSRWSDFSFWGQLLSELKTGFLRYLSTPRYAPELLALSHLARAMWGIPAAILLACSKQFFMKF